MKASNIVITALGAAALVSVLFYWLAAKTVREYATNQTARKLTDDERRRIIEKCEINNNVSKATQQLMSTQFMVEYPGVNFEDIRKACLQGYANAANSAERKSRVTADQCSSGRLCTIESLKKVRPCASATVDSDCCNRQGEKCVRTEGATRAGMARDIFNEDTLPNTNGNRMKKIDNCVYYSMSALKDGSGWKCSNQFPIVTGLNWDTSNNAYQQHSCTTSSNCKRKAKDKYEADKNRSDYKPFLKEGDPVPADSPCAGTCSGYISTDGTTCCDLNPTGSTKLFNCRTC